MGEVLAADTRLRFSPLGTILSPPDVADKALAEADRRSPTPRPAYGDDGSRQGQGPARDGAQGLSRSTCRSSRRAPTAIAPMRDGFILLANVRFFEGNADGARDALRYVFALDGTVRWKKELFPQQMKKLVVEARLLVRDARDGAAGHRLRSAGRRRLAQRLEAPRPYAGAADRRAQRAQLHQLRAARLGADDAGVQRGRRRRGVARAGDAVAAAAQPAGADRSRARRHRRLADAADAEGGVRRARRRHAGAGAHGAGRRARRRGGRDPDGVPVRRARRGASSTGSR